MIHDQKNYHNKIRLMLLLSAFGVMAFIFIAFTFPVKEKKLSHLYTKSSTNAAEELTDQLLQTAERTKDQSKETQEEKLVEVAQKRKEEMLKTADENPAGFLLNSLPGSVVGALPENAAALVEKETEVHGKLSIVHIDDFKNNVSKSVYEVEDESSDKKYELKFAAGEPSVVSGAEVAAKGLAIDSKLVLESSQAPDSSDKDTYKLQTIAASPVSPATQNLKVAAMVINFQDNATIPFTNEQVKNAVFDGNNSLKKFYAETSNNRVSLTGDVMGPYTLNLPNFYCANIYHEISMAATLAARNAGFDIDSYPYHMLIMPFSNACGYSGLGTVGPNAFVNYATAWINGSIDLWLLGHEFGHNLGLHHATTLNCGTKQIDALGKCSSNEYGDFYDILGFSGTPNKFNSPHLSAMNWLEANSIKTVTTTGTHTISRLGTTGTQILKIAKPKGISESTQLYYYVAYRNPTGYDLNLPSSLINGSSIHLWDDSPFSRTSFLDVTPDGNVGNAGLTDFATFSDPTGITISQWGHSSSTADIRIIFPDNPACSRAAPTLTIKPTTYPENPAVPPGSKVNYTAKVTNNDSAACSNSTFNLSARYPASGWLAQIQQNTLSNYPVSVPANKSLDLTDKIVVTSPTNSSAGSYKLDFDISDSLFSNHTAFASATYIVANINPSIDSFDPTSGEVGDKVTINGRNFGKTAGKVFIGHDKDSLASSNKVEATIINWGDTKIIARVAPGAFTGGVYIETSSKQTTNTASYFTVQKRLKIIGFSPQPAFVNSSVTISGDSFGALSAVFFAYGTTAFPQGLQIATVSNTDSTIVAVIPPGVPNGKVKLVLPNNTVVISPKDIIVKYPDGTIQPTQTVTGNSVSLKWSESNPNSQSYLEYGPTDRYGFTTGVVSNISPQNVTLSNLKKCTTYQYRIITYVIGVRGTGKSVRGSFTTKGCPGSGDVKDYKAVTVTKDNGGKVELKDSNSKGVSLNVPTTALGEDLDFQIEKLEKSSFITEVTPPADKQIVGNDVYHLNAYSQSAVDVKTFNDNLDVTFTYSADDVTGIQEDSLTIQRWDGNVWNNLTSCVIDKNAKTVNCKTANFSDFALVGDPVTPSPTPSPSNSPSPSPSPSTSVSPSPSTPPPSPSITPSPSSSPIGENKPSPSPSGSPGLNAREGDLNNDGKVNIIDLSILLRKWSKTADIAGVDLNHDGKVNIVDLSILLRRWTK